SEQAGEHLDRSRFAGAVGAEEAVEGAALDAQLDGVDRAEAVEVARQLVGLNRQGHGFRSAGRRLRIVRPAPDRENRPCHYRTFPAARLTRPAAPRSVRPRPVPRPCAAGSVAGRNRGPSPRSRQRPAAAARGRSGPPRGDMLLQSLARRCCASASGLFTGCPTVRYLRFHSATPTSATAATTTTPSAICNAPTQRCRPDSSCSAWEVHDTRPFFSSSVSRRKTPATKPCWLSGLVPVPAR